MDHQLLERALRYRSVAVEVRARAESMSSAEVKAVFLKLADDYDNLAESLERDANSRD